MWWASDGGGASQTEQGRDLTRIMWSDSALVIVLWFLLRMADSAAHVTQAGLVLAFSVGHPNNQSNQRRFRGKSGTGSSVTNSSYTGRSGLYMVLNI